jgi:hypothetical protein
LFRGGLGEIDSMRIGVHSYLLGSLTVRV